MSKQDLLADCRQLSSGTIATLTGARRYEDIDGWREDFCDWVDGCGIRFVSWVDAWESFRLYVLSEFGICFAKG
jgi:hypothetical protein